MIGSDSRAAGAELLDRPELSPRDGRRAVSAGGWLFDAREFEPESCPADLGAIVAGLAQAVSGCAALGASYLPVTIPAKRDLINVTPSSDRGWVAELNARLRDVDEVELMNLFGVLRHAARHGPPYHRGDADWNDLGAFFVGRALLKEAHKRVPELAPAPLSELHLRPLEGYRGTLADAPRLELLEGELVPGDLGWPAEEGVAIDASRLHALRMPVESDLAKAGAARARVYANPAASADVRVAVVGDEASLPIVVWLAERTRRTTFFDSRALPAYQLELEAPALVIHLLRETDPLAGWP
jgi:SGNH hydrolase-like domain, acetyltransferase AlgX